MTVGGKNAVRKVDPERISPRETGGAAGFAAGRAKRAVDVLASTLLLGLSLPFWPVIALLIVVGSRGPVFYSQVRVGKDGRVFTLRKFRSMIDRAEENGALWAGEKDPRVTPVGFVLRRLHLDELPQFVNVLRGEMSLIGPRPERPEFVRELKTRIPGYDLRHRVKPGLTGWAQVNYHYASSVAASREKLAWDLYYVFRATMELDLEILARTLGTVFKWRE
ncbi:MAG: sugar transferase [Candidatus Aminicenantes bacterium]|nr:sugar transferase [Candidatus Aminicenantes bacterium]